MGTITLHINITSELWSKTASEKGNGTFNNDSMLRSPS